MCVVRESQSFPAEETKRLMFSRNGDSAFLWSSGCWLLNLNQRSIKPMPSCPHTALNSPSLGSTLEQERTLIVDSVAVSKITHMLTHSLILGKHMVVWCTISARSELYPLHFLKWEFRTLTYYTIHQRAGAVAEITSQSHTFILHVAHLKTKAIVTLHCNNTPLCQLCNFTDVILIQ